jgi:hypothetical protein
VVDELGQAVSTLAPDSAAVDSITVTVSAGSTAKGLLRVQGVFPDAQSLAWLLSANPTLRAVDSLQAGEKLRVPILRPGSEAERAVKAGNLVAFLLAPALRDSVEAAVTQLSPVVTDTINDDAARQLEAAIDVAREINLEGSGASPKAMRLVLDRVERLSDLVSQLDSATPDERREAAFEAVAYQAELTEVQAAVEAGRAPIVNIIIDLLYIDDASTVPPGPYLLRWATAGDRENCREAMCGRPFRVHRPYPSAQLNLNGEYVVWAVRGNGRASCDTPVDPVQGGEPRWEVRVFRNPPPPPGSCPR